MDTRLSARLISVFALALVALAPAPLAAHTPESPKVQAAIKRGVSFLTNEDNSDPRPGAQALMGIALLKNGVPPNHPKIQGAVTLVKRQIPDNDPAQASIENIYSVGLSIIFLITLDPEKYHNEISCFLNFLYAKQKPHGGWGYYAEDLGDTSMTQYAVLSSWQAKQAGFEVPMYKMEGVADWLIRTQDPSGAFAYKGRIAPEGTLVAQDQDKIRQSMAAAGGGCVFILADMFQFDTVSKKKEDLPSALKEAKVKEKDSGSSNHPGSRINAKQLRETQVRVNEWMKKNYTINPSFGFRYYYFYALERYMSFRDIIEHTSDKEPRWYNEGVDYILQHQKEDGSCSEEGSECGPVCDTSFAILFMDRATQKTIEKAKNYGAGMLVGGRGLGGEKDTFEMRNGQVVAKPLMGPAEDLLKMLDDPNMADYDQVLEMMSELPSQQLETLLASHGDKLRQLAAGKEPEARMAAVMALGKTRSLDNVPALIYALSKDEDREVVIEARKALERISRNPAGYGPQDDYNEEQRRTAVEKWKAWYHSLRPDAEVDF